MSFESPTAADVTSFCSYPTPKTRKDGNCYKRYEQKFGDTFYSSRYGIQVTQNTHLRDATCY